MASSGGLAAGPDNHGDVLAVQNAAFRLAELADQAKLDGIETISTEEKLGGLGTQTLKISAANVQQLSDHTIAPGGGFGEHDAIRIDGDSVDQIQLRSDAGKWVDTTIEMAGYRIYAHETTDGNPASADAYVMVQAANTGNVHLNPPVARDDRILTTVGTNADFSVPEWALLANDTGGTKLDLAGVVDYTGLSLISWNTAAGTNENVTVSEDDTRGGSFKYQATDGDTVSETATVSIFNAPAASGAPMRMRSWSEARRPRFSPATAATTSSSAVALETRSMAATATTSSSSTNPPISTAAPTAWPRAAGSPPARATMAMC